MNEKLAIITKNLENSQLEGNILIKLDNIIRNKLKIRKIKILLKSS